MGDLHPAEAEGDAYLSPEAIEKILFWRVIKYSKALLVIAKRDCFCGYVRGLRCATCLAKEALRSGDDT